MKITRPQPEARSTTRRLKWWQFLKRLNRWEADRDYNRIEQALERYQSRMWANGLQCLECQSIPAKDAKYCHVCGADLYPTTEPVLPVMPSPPSPLHLPTKTMLNLYNMTPGNGWNTKELPVINTARMLERQATGAMQLDVLRQKMQEREDMRKKEGQK
jgi:hypothetical protein